MSRQAVLYFVLRRFAALLILLTVISFAVFSLLYLSPGSAEQILLGPQTSSPELLERVREQYNLDEPFLTQYWLWVKDAVQLDFGQSIQTKLPVTDSIRSHLRISLLLGLYAYVLTMVFGVALGIWAALRKRTAADRTIVGLSVVGMSAPAFVSGILLLYVFAIVLPWFPAFGQGEGFLDELRHLTLPAIALSLAAGAFVVKHTRAAMINVLDQDYMTFARARGLSPGRVLMVYGLRNALIPVVTASAIVLGSLITGAVLVEVAFSLPGIGTLLVQAVTAKDVPLVQGVTLTIATVIMVANLLADLAYVAVDPRIRFERAGA